MRAWCKPGAQNFTQSAPRFLREDGEAVASVLTADELAVIEGVTEAERLRPPKERGQPVGPDIRSWVVLLACMRGWRPKKYRELPGNEVLWQVYRQLQAIVRYRQSLQGPL